MSSLRRYDVQAGYAFVLAVLSILPLIAAVALTLRNYEPDLAQIVYGSKKYLVIHHLCVMMAMGLSFVAVALGWNSAGERRNDQPQKSWLGFFVGGIVFTLTVIVVLAFYMLRLEQRPVEASLAMNLLSFSWV
jgi:uncharacterized membrane protein YbhN (UPF0104 family)